MLWEAIDLLRVPRIVARALAVFLVSGFLAIALSFFAMRAADHAQSARFEALMFRPAEIEYSFPTFVPEAEYYLADVNSGLFWPETLLYQSSQDSKAVSKVRARSRRPIDGNYSSFWWLHTWNFVTQDHDSLLYYFNAWASLPNRSDTYGEYEEFNSTSEEQPRSVFNQYGPDLTPRRAYYSNPIRINGLKFYRMAIEDQVFPALDHYAQIGAYPVAQYYARMINIMNINFNVLDDRNWAASSDRIMLTLALFNEVDANLSDYDTFLYIYESLRKYQWHGSRIPINPSQPGHICAVATLNAAYSLRRSRPISETWNDILNEIDSARGFCANSGAFYEVLSLMKMKAGIVILDPNNWSARELILENTEEISRIEMMIHEMAAAFEPEVFPNLVNDAADYVEAALEMAGSARLRLEAELEQED